MAGERKVIGAFDDALQATIDEHRKDLRRAIARLEDRIVDRMRRLTTSKSGRLVGVKTNLKQAQRLHAELATLFEEEFGEAVESYLDEFPAIARAIESSWSELDAAVKFVGADRDMIAALRRNAYEEFTAFGAQAQRAIAKQMYDYVAAQGSWTDLVNMVRGVLTGHADAKGRPLEQYVDTWSIDLTMGFERTLSVAKADEAGLGEHWMYGGSIIEDSRDFCKERAGHIYTTDEVESWNALDWDGKRGNVWTDLGGWRCRHVLQPVDVAWFPKLTVNEYSSAD